MPTFEKAPSGHQTSVGMHRQLAWLASAAVASRAAPALAIAAASRTPCVSNVILRKRAHGVQ